MKMIFHSHANKTHFHKKGRALGLNLKVRVFGTWWLYFVFLLPWPTSPPCSLYYQNINRDIPCLALHAMKAGMNFGLHVGTSDLKTDLIYQLNPLIPKIKI